VPALSAGGLRFITAFASLGQLMFTVLGRSRRSTAPRRDEGCALSELTSLARYHDLIPTDLQYPLQTLSQATGEIRMKMAIESVVRVPSVPVEGFELRKQSFSTSLRLRFQLLRYERVLLSTGDDKTAHQTTVATQSFERLMKF